MAAGMPFSHPLWNARREMLEAALIEAASELLEHTRAAGCTYSKDGVKVVVSIEAPSTKEVN